MLPCFAVFDNYPTILDSNDVWSTRDTDIINFAVDFEGVGIFYIYCEAFSLKLCCSLNDHLIVFGGVIVAGWLFNLVLGR
jgi:hypothetical protein